MKGGRPQGGLLWWLAWVVAGMTFFFVLAHVLS